jgi:hypothetical protein
MPTSIEARIEGTKATIEQLDRTLGKLNARAEEIRAQLLKAMGALEMLEEIRKEEALQNGSQGPEVPRGTPAPVDPPSSSDDDEGTPHEGDEPDGESDEVES